MKNRLVLLFTAVLCWQNILAQEYVEYQGTRYPTHSSLSEDNPTVKIRPFNQQKFDATKGIVEIEVNGKLIKYDCHKIYEEDLTNEYLEIPYEVNDTSSYGDVLVKRVQYIEEEITLLNEIKELIANYKSLHGREPLGNTQRIFLQTLIDNRKGINIKVLEAAQKAAQKNRFDKKMEPINEVLLPKIDSELSYLNSLISDKDNWEKILQASLTGSCISRLDNYPKAEVWAKSILEINKATAFVKVPNPFLLNEIEVPNPNFKDHNSVEKIEEGYLTYSNNEYNYSMKIPSCFKEEFELFCRDGGSNYDFLYGHGQYEGVLLNIATQKHMGYMYLDGQSIYDNDMSGRVYQYLSKQDGESNKKIISKDVFDNGYLIICNLTYGGEPFTSKFYAFNLRNNVQLRFYIRYPQNMNNEFEEYIQNMIESIEAF